MSNPASATRKASLFKNGRSQAVRIPKEFEFSGKEVTISKDGERLIIAPAEPQSLGAWLRSLGTIDDEWPEIHDPLPEDVVI